MNQLFYNIFNPKEIFFSRDLFVTSWACAIGIWSTLAQWIWLDKVTSYVIIIITIVIIILIYFIFLVARVCVACVFVSGEQF